MFVRSKTVVTAMGVAQSNLGPGAYVRKSLLFLGWITNFARAGRVVHVFPSVFTPDEYKLKRQLRKE